MVFVYHNLTLIYTCSWSFLIKSAQKHINQTLSMPIESVALVHWPLPANKANSHLKCFHLFVCIFNCFAYSYNVKHDYHFKKQMFHIHHKSIARQEPKVSCQFGPCRIGTTLTVFLGCLFKRKGAVSQEFHIHRIKEKKSRSREYTIVLSVIWYDVLIAIYYIVAPQKKAGWPRFTLR